MRPQQIENPWHRRQNRDARRLDLAYQICWRHPRLEVNLRGEQCRDPQAHELSENMAQRKCVKEAQRMKNTLVLQILLQLLFNRTQAGEHVSMCMDDSLWV